MIGLCSYNLCGDINTLDQYPQEIKSMIGVRVGSGVFDHVNIESDITSPISTSIPIWDVDTIFNCDFNENTFGGNVRIKIDEINRLKLKRRKVGEYNWITILDKPVSSVNDINFSKIDRLLPSGESYYYAVVPCLNDQEGNYIELAEPILTQFDGLFICEKDAMIRLLSNPSYSDMIRNKETGMTQPIGNKYPTVVRNSSANYVSGTFGGTVLGSNFESTKQVNRKEVVEQLSAYDAILNNDKPKIIKDFNGNIWLGMITSGIPRAYKNEFGMGVVDISASFVEQGDPNSQRDLYYNGLVDTLG